MDNRKDDREVCGTCEHNHFDFEEQGYVCSCEASDAYGCPTGYMDPYDKESWELTGAKMVVVDGEKIKEDTYYRCIEGEIVEVTEDGEIVEE